MRFNESTCQFYKANNGYILEFPSGGNPALGYDEELNTLVKKAMKRVASDKDELLESLTQDEQPEEKITLTGLYVFPTFAGMVKFLEKHYI